MCQVGAKGGRLAGQDAGGQEAGGQEAGGKGEGGGSGGGQGRAACWPGGRRPGGRLWVRWLPGEIDVVATYGWMVILRSKET